MNNRVTTYKLSKREVNDLQKKAWEKLGSSQKLGQVIGSSIFSILESHARVMYYPLGNGAPWAFVHLNGEVGSKPYVVLNTSRPIDEQVFGAAHELYHIWFDLRSDIVSSESLDQNVYYDELTIISESKANRFAAEFLIEERTLLRELSAQNIDEKHLDVKDILLLCNIFCVPYRTMTKRLFEINLLSLSSFKEFDSVAIEELVRLRMRYAIDYTLGDERVNLGSFIDLSLSAYEKNLISFEKLEYLLSLNMIESKDLGVIKPEKSSLPTDDEIDQLME